MTVRGNHHEAGDRRPTVYCLVPRELAELHEPLRHHFRDDSEVEVVVERRVGERRGSDRRAAEPASAPVERRVVRAVEGRRVADRRAAAVPVGSARPLPRRARPHAGRLVFFERLEPAAEELEDRDTARLVIRFQAGDEDAFATLYLRYFDRVYAYLKIIVRDAHEAEDLTQGVFLKLMESLRHYERRAGPPFRAWLFTIVRNRALTHLRKQDRAEVEEPAAVERRREEAGDQTGADSALDWITDRDLILFVERLPPSQRQVLLLRYLLGLSSSETAEVLGYTPNQVRKLQQRAIAFLRQRLAAVGRAPRRGERRVRVRVRPSQALVVRTRRFALR